MRLPALLAVAAVSALDFQEEQLEWVKPEVTGAVPEPREGHCAHLVQQSLYIYGGSTHTPSIGSTSVPPMALCSRQCTAAS